MMINNDVVLMLITLFVKIINNNPQILFTIITAIAAIVSGWGAQLINNSLTKSRQRLENERFVLRNLYYRIIPEIYDYFILSTDFRKNDQTDNFRHIEIKNGIMKILSDNLLYLSNEIYAAYRDYRRVGYYDDNKGTLKDEVEISLICTIVKEYIFFGMSLKENISKTDLIYGCYLLLWKFAIYNCGGYGQAYMALSMRFNIEQEELSLKRFNQLINIDNLDRDEQDKQLRALLNEILKSDISNEEREDYINYFFVNNIEVSDSFAIAMSNNLDINFGSLSITSRKMYRYEVLRALYEGKYYPETKDNNINYFSKEKFDNIHNELKRALEYWIYKGMVNNIVDGDIIKFVITPIGEDFYEEHINSS
ncbi:hypothetical protein ACTHOS_15960 [Bacillus safensis]|nr:MULTISPECIES: hypothetical protein [Bacillus]MDH6563688.1 hypothetical protein [Bacillus sp. TBS-096]MEC0923320.1 hypothetical protein [Bacillus safensis]MEC0996636.1 hypothetical protein [Bacillus safensis]MEC0998460.1 hypothetical protein [Bacillus safensis]MEC2427392.1 hypothetical protein [Bacillus safensis]